MVSAPEVEELSRVRIVPREQPADDVRPWVILCSSRPWQPTGHRQHALARELAGHFRVLYVDPPARGRPTDRIEPVGRDIWRAEVADAFPGCRRLGAANRRLRRSEVRRLRGWLADRPGRRLLWLDEELAAPLAGRLGEAAVICDATDPDWTTAPSWDRPRRRHALDRAVASADLVLAGSSRLASRRPPGRGAVRVVEDACDPAPFVRPVPPPAWLSALVQPRIGYVGAVDRRVLDVELVVGIARARPEWQLVLVGPVDSRTARPLLELANVQLPGAVPPDQLPAVLGGFDVGLVPYRLDGSVDHLQPRQTLQYLAAGLPVVSTPLPAQVAWSAPLRLGHDAGEFVTGIELALAEADDPFAQVRRRHFAVRQSWPARGEQVRTLLAGLLLPRGTAGALA